MIARDHPPSVEIYVYIIFPLLFIGCYIMLAYYAEPNLPMLYYIPLFLGYFFSFGILLLVPIDIAACIYDRRYTDLLGLNYSRNVNTLSLLYAIMFWGVFILGSFLLVFFGFLCSDGHFDPLGQFTSSVKRMMINAAVLYLALAVFLILVCTQVASIDLNSIKLSCIIASNFLYEAILMVLIGYGLVQFPWYIWQCSDLEYSLKVAQMKVCILNEDLNQYRQNCQLQVANVYKTNASVRESGKVYAEFVHLMDILVSECPAEFHTSTFGEIALNKHGKIAIDSLVNLRRNLFAAKSMYKMSREKLLTLKMYAYDLEDMLKAKTSERKIIYWSTRSRVSEGFYYYWHIYVLSIIQKCTAILCGCLSALSLIGIVCSMYSIDPQGSPYFLVVHDPSVNTATIALFVLLTLGYSMYVTLWTLFRFRILSVRTGFHTELVPFNSSPASLIFNCSCCTRIAAPLAFFYLGWISENGLRNTERWVDYPYPDVYVVTTDYNATNVERIPMPSAFSNFYQIQDIAFVDSTFGNVFPILLFVVVVLVSMNLFNRVLVMCHLSKYQFGHTLLLIEDKITRGHNILMREKAATLRALQKCQTIHKWLFGDFWSSDLSQEQSRRRAELTSGILNNECANELELREPAPLSSYIEVPCANRYRPFKNKWRRAYIEVKQSGELHIYGDQESSSQGMKPDTSLHLRLLISMISNRAKLVLYLNVNGDNHKIRFSSIGLLNTFEERLNEWKDYIIAQNDNARPPSVLPFGGESEVVTVQKDLDEITGVTANNAINSHIGSLNSELDDIKIEVDDHGACRNDEKDHEDDKVTFSPLSAISLFFGGQPQINPSVEKVVVDDASSSMLFQKPVALEGVLEKKRQTKSLIASEWTKRYLRVDENSKCIMCYKSTDIDNLGYPKEVISLRLVKAIIPYSSRKKDSNREPLRFNIEFADDTKELKFRALSQSDYDKWQIGLNAWREYFLLNDDSLLSSY